MSDVLTITDLEAAKKHDTFHSEVITGKAGGLSTGADIDYATNAVTRQTQKTLPKVLRDLGMMVQTWTATTGGTLTDASQVFLDDITASAGKGNYYAWTGAFPKVVAPGADPAAVAGFVMRSDAGLRAEIIPSVSEAMRRSYAEAGYNLVVGSFESGGTLVNSNDVLLQERTGKAYTGPAGTVAAGTNPASGGFVDRSGSLYKNLTGVVYYTEFFVGTGGDDLPRIKAAHDKANLLGWRVEAGGKLNITANSATNVTVKTNTDLCGSTFTVKDGANGAEIYSIAPSSTFAMNPATVAAMQPQLTEGAFIIPALSDIPSLENCLIIVKNNQRLSRRGAGGYEVYREDSFIHLRGGNIIGDLLCDHTVGTLTVTVKPLERGWLEFGGLNYVQDFTGTDKRCTLVKSQRNQTKYKQIFTETNLIDNVADSSSIIQAYGVGFLTLEDIGGENTNAGIAGNSGYCLSHQHCVAVSYNRVSPNSGWGVTNTNWCKEWVINDSYLNRIDNHYGLGNLSINDCRIIANNVEFGFGAGKISTKNLTVVQGRNEYDPSNNAPIALAVLNLRAGWQLGYRGEIVMENTTIEIRGDLPTQAARPWIGAFNYGQQEIDGCDPTVPMYLPNVTIKGIHLKVVGALQGQMQFFGTLLWDKYLYNSQVLAPSRISVDTMTSNHESPLLIYKPFKGVTTNLSDALWNAKTCTVHLTNIHNNLTDIDVNAIVLANYDAWRYTKSLFDWGLQNANEDASRIFWDVVVYNCTGAFYINSINSKLKAHHSNVVEVKAFYAGTNLNVCKVIDSKAWPLFRLGTDYEWYFADNRQSELLQGCEIIPGNLSGLTVSAVSLRARQRLIDCYTASSAPIAQVGVDRLWRSFETATDMYKNPT